jgi:hypothetical protein
MHFVVQLILHEPRWRNIKFMYAKRVVLRSALVGSYIDYKNVHGVNNKIPEYTPEA